MTKKFFIPFASSIHHHCPYPALTIRTVQSASDRRLQQLGSEVNLEKVYEKTEEAQALASAVRRTMRRS